jgi:hypothetical protein
LNSGGVLVTPIENEKFMQALGLQRDPLIRLKPMLARVYGLNVKSGYLKEA